MTHFAIYDVVADDPFFLSDSPATVIKDIELDFVDSADFGVRSVLSYMVDPGSASGVTFEMHVSSLQSNGAQPFTLIIPATSLPSAPPYLRQEVINKDTFKPVNGGVGIHKLRIKVTSGAANFSDIVHMYQFTA